MTKRTSTDFSKHVLTTTSREDMLIHVLAIPKTNIDSVTFINTNGVMAVTGDYGNWIFCREFHPSAESSVCDHYWLEKLRVASSQEPGEFDPKRAQEEIKELLEDTDCTLSEEEIAWLNNLSEAADDGEYAYIARIMDRPSSFEDEMIPKGKVVKYWLQVVFDAFEEICHRMKEKLADDPAILNTENGDPFVPFG